MEKNPQKIAEQIIELVSELADLAGAPAGKKLMRSKKSPVLDKKDMPGATGGIRFLVKEGKLDLPKQLPEIMEFLRQEGRHYPRPAVSMGLLNLVRERILTRLREKGDKSWKYVVRK